MSTTPLAPPRLVLVWGFENLSDGSVNSYYAVSLVDLEALAAVARKPLSGLPMYGLGDATTIVAMKADHHYPYEELAIMAEADFLQFYTAGRVPEPGEVLAGFNRNEEL